MTMVGGRKTFLKRVLPIMMEENCLFKKRSRQLEHHKTAEEVWQTKEWNNGLVVCIQSLRAGFPGLTSGSGKNSVFRNSLVGFRCRYCVKQVDLQSWLLYGTYGSLNDTPLQMLSQKLSTPVCAYPWHWLGYVGTPGTGEGTCIPLAVIRVCGYPWNWSGSGYLHTPGTGQGQGTCIPLELVMIWSEIQVKLAGSKL